jgi:hypothetical protein
MNIWSWAWLIGALCCLFAACYPAIIKKPSACIVSLLLFPPLLVSLIYWLPAFSSGNTHEYKAWAYVFMSLWMLSGYIGTFAGWLVHLGIKNARAYLKKKQPSK